MRKTYALALLLALGSAGCKNPTAAEDVNRRLIAAMHALADHLEAGRMADAKATLSTLRELTAAAKTIRISKADDEALQKQFALPLDAATKRLREAAAAGKLSAAELQGLKD